MRSLRETSVADQLGLNSDDVSGDIPASSVISRVYRAFAEELGRREGCEAAAERLRKVLMVDGNRSEAAIRAALFPADDS